MNLPTDPLPKIDMEMEAMREVFGALNGLSADSQDRILRAVAILFGLDVEEASDE